MNDVSFLETTETLLSMNGQPIDAATSGLITGQVRDKYHDQRSLDVPKLSICGSIWPGVCGGHPTVTQSPRSTSNVHKANVECANSALALHRRLTLQQMNFFDSPYPHVPVHLSLLQRYSYSYIEFGRNYHRDITSITIL